MFDRAWYRYALALGAIVAAGMGLKLHTNRIVRRAEAAHPPQGEFVTVEGVRLHYVQRGTGQPVLLIHGDGGSTYDWTMSIFDTLAEHYQVIAFDRPGLGYSERPADGASPFVQARLLHEAAAALGATAPVLVGHSRGGNVALAYALAYPDDIAGVVTLAAAPYGGQIALHNRLLAVPILGPLLAHTLYVPLGGEAVKAGLDMAFAPECEAPPDYVAAYAAYELRPSQLLAHAKDQVVGHAIMQEMAEHYAELDAPLVVVHGAADRNVSFEQARRLAQTAPNAELIEVPGAGHELMFLHSDVVLQAIRRVEK